MDYRAEKVRKEHSISGYLEEKGIHPDRDGGDRKFYCCPFPDHNEKTASFNIFKGDDGNEVCYCFGCKKGGDIVTFKSIMEGIPRKQAYADLSKRDQQAFNSLGI